MTDNTTKIPSKSLKVPKPVHQKMKAESARLDLTIEDVVLKAWEAYEREHAFDGSGDASRELPINKPGKSEGESLGTKSSSGTVIEPIGTLGDIKNLCEQILAALQAPGAPRAKVPSRYRQTVQQDRKVLRKKDKVLGDSARRTRTGSSGDKRGAA